MRRSVVEIPSHESLASELAELISIPSVSADPTHAADLLAAAVWVCDSICRTGGEAEVVTRNGRPLVIGEVPASRNASLAPTVLCYAHFDVQPPDPLSHWDTSPFELCERDGWLCARGVADDKAHLYMLLKGASLLASAGELSVNVRFVCDGEEEVGGRSVVEWLDADPRVVDAAIVLDAGMVGRDTPAFTVGLRGLCYFKITVRTGERDLHSGVFGGVALNAVNALMQALDGLSSEFDGRVPKPLRSGVATPTPADLAAAAQMPSGADELAAQGATARDGQAAADYYLRTTCEPAIDVHGIDGGSPRLLQTVVPVEASANVSMRLAYAQDPREVADVLERLVREAAPTGADVRIELWSSTRPALVPSDAAAVQIAQDAFESVLGVRPLLVRNGGTIPIVPSLTDRKIPTIVTGFAVNDSNIHSPNERIPVEHLDRGLETITEVFRRFSSLRSERR